MQKNRRFLFIAMLLLSCFAYPENPMQNEHDKQLFKYNPFSCDFFTAWSLKYDENYLNGLVFGGTVKSYPLKPVKLEFGAAGHIFTNDECFLEFTGHIGCLIKSVEIFAQYKYFQEHIFGVGISRYF